MQVSIGIVNWNTREYLQQCLASVFMNLDGLEAEVIVVDNGSTDGSVDMVRNEFPQVRLIDTGENLGFSKANNLAFQQSVGDYFLLLNSDTVVQPNSISSLVEFMHKNPETGAVGARLLNGDGTLQRSCSPFPTPLSELFDALYLSKIFPKSRLFGRFAMSYWDFDTIREVDFAGGSCLLVRREAVYKPRNNNSNNLSQSNSTILSQPDSAKSDSTVLNQPDSTKPDSTKPDSTVLSQSNSTNLNQPDSATISQPNSATLNQPNSTILSQPHSAILSLSKDERRYNLSEDGELDTNLLDERFFMYSEEADLCYRLKKGGWKVIFLPDAQVIHYGGRSSRLDVNRTSVQLCRSKYIFMKKHYGLASALAYRLIVMLSSIIRVIAWAPGILISRNRRIYGEKVSIQGRILSWAVTVK